MMSQTRLADQLDMDIISSLGMGKKKGKWKKGEKKRKEKEQKARETKKRTVCLIAMKNKEIKKKRKVSRF